MHAPGGPGDDGVERVLELAERLGIQRGYWDVAGQWHDASLPAVLAAARAMGVPLGPLDAEGTLNAVIDALGAFVAERLEPPLEPVAVVWDDDDLVVPVRPRTDPTDLAVDGASVTLTLDGHDGPEPVLAVVVDADAGVVRVRQPADGWPRGRHELRVVVDGQTRTCSVLAAPRRVPQLAEDARLWGVFAPVYAPQDGGGLGAHLGVLDRLAAAIAPRGGRVVGTLPMLATFLDEPFDPSPYSPVSRRWWNEAHLDLTALPELDTAGRALVQRLAAEGGPGGPAAATAGARYDARAQSAAVHEVLAHLVATEDAWPASSRHDLDAFVAERPDVEQYGRFRAVARRLGSGWQGWPAELRGRPLGDDDLLDDDRALARAHVIAQFLLDRQLRELAESCAARDVRLYLDLPLGCHGGGYDTWRHPDQYLWGVSVGAPPDEFFDQGQDWGFPPLSPLALREDGYRHLGEVLAGHLAVAGVLRIDHVMSLYRLFWVPSGLGPTQGVYVHYRTDELFALLCIEAARHDCIVVGEDLGTVPTEVRDAMEAHGLLGMYVAEFAVPDWPGAAVEHPSHRQVAFVDTHDTPTFAAWLVAERDERPVQVANLASHLLHHGHPAGGEGEGAEGEAAPLLGGLLDLLGASESPLVLVALEDLWGDHEPQNIPGTLPDRPNWVHRYPGSVDELLDRPAVARVLADLQGSRLAAHVNARAFEGAPSA